MTPAMLRRLPGAACFLAGWCALAAAEPKIDLSEYRTADKAVAAKVGPPRGGLTGFLGVAVQRDARGRLVVEEVQPDSPGDKAGVKKGDIVTRVGDHAVRTPEAFREWVQTHGPGDSVKITLVRDDKPTEVSAALAATSRPMKVGARPVFLGVELGQAKEGEGVRVEKVTPDSPADKAGLKPGDRITKLDGTEFTRAARLADVLSEKRPGDILVFAVRRDDKEVQLRATLATQPREGGRGPRGDFGPPPPWTKNTFRLGVVLFEFPDVKHNAKATAKDWDEAIFSCNKTSPGSLADYYHEVSAGKFKLEGKVFDWVEVGKKRGDYVQGSGTSGRTVPLADALEKLTARDGKDALKDLDGLLFVYAGESVRGNRGSVYAPHAGVVNFQQKRFGYLLSPEGGGKMTTISGMAKEMGQVLGLPDLAARPDQPGSEGLGAWCAMSSPRGDGKPGHYSAWAKEKLGWLSPTVIDPTVKQKLILAPVERSPRECFKVLVRPDGSEYFLLENRKKVGFDDTLPAEGLLIWRVVNDRPVLEESHGVEGPTGPSVHLNLVPYPSTANTSFTPDTVPSSKSPLGGGLPVHITNIRRLPDGRITFHIGYEYR
jgi:M6 family metalloprotease-like protein